MSKHRLGSIFYAFCTYIIAHGPFGSGQMYGFSMWLDNKHFISVILSELLSSLPAFSVNSHARAQKAIQQKNETHQRIWQNHIRCYKITSEIIRLTSLTSPSYQSSWTAQSLKRLSPHFFTPAQLPPSSSAYAVITDVSRFIVFRVTLIIIAGIINPLAKTALSVCQHRYHFRGGRR